MARGMYISIVGDASSYFKALRQASTATNKFTRDVERSTRGGIAASGLFKSMGRSIAFASGTFLGGAGLVATMKASIQAASDLNEQMSKTNRVFGDSAAGVEAWAKTTTRAMGLSQRQALATASSFGALFKPIGLVGPQAAEQAEKLTQLGANLASFYNTDVQDALDAIRSGIVGESEPLRRYGVLLSESRVQAEALAETHKKSVKELTNQDKALARIHLIFKDAAVAQGDFARTSGGLANQMRIAQANIDNLKVTIGQALLPTVSRIVSRFNDWMSNSKNQQRVMDDVKQVASVLTGVLGGLKHAFEVLNDITGSTRNSLKLLFGVFVAYKSLKLVSSLAGIATQLGLIGTKATVAAGEAGALRASLMNLSTLGPIGIAIAITVTAFTVQPYVTKGLNKIFEGIGLRKRPTPLGGGPLGGRSRPVWRRGRLVWSGSGAPYQGETSDPGGRLAGGTRAISADPFATARGAFAQPPPTLPGAAGADRPRYTRAQLNQFFEARIARLLYRAQFKSLQEQLRAQKRVAALLRERIKNTQDITRQLKLEDQLLQVQADIRGTRADIASKAADVAQARADRRREAAERAQAAAERRRARLVARQFGILGFGPGGEPRVPNLRQLRRQFAAMRSDLRNASPRLQREFARIGKVLTEAIVPPEIRSKVREMLNAIRDEMRKGMGGGTPRGFTYNRPGVGGRSLAFAAAGLNVGTVNVYNTHNIGDLEHQLTKRQAGRAHNRRGAR